MEKLIQTRIKELINELVDKQLLKNKPDCLWYVEQDETETGLEYSEYNTLYLINYVAKLINKDVTLINQNK